MNSKILNQKIIRARFQLDCLRLLADGSGIGYQEGLATFVPGLLPGETGLVEVTESKKKFQRARLLTVIQPSPARVDPPCPVFEECGGCQLQHMTYAETLNWKQRWVEDALQRIGKLNVPVRPTIGMSDPWRYRNKVRLHRDQGGQLGYFKEKSRVLVGFRDCLLLSERMNRWIWRTEAFLTGKERQEIHTLTFRENTRQEGLLLLEGGNYPAVVAEIQNNPEFPEALAQNGLRSIWWTDSQGGLKLVWGDETFCHTILGNSFKVTPLSFLQVNSLQTEVLYELVRTAAELSGEEQVWDLYTGIGTLALTLAPKAKKVLGIEENPFAVQDARINTADHGNSAKVDFLAGKVEDVMISGEDKPDVVILDPPRAGMHPDVVKRLLEIEPKRIVYVSCDPGTLARDLGILAVGKYSVESVQPVDMFPWTGHVETVVSLKTVTS
ncbi:23S rRNA (uracil(1939)-C(5))-methyltransferase RlmD [Desulfosporosinus sp. PR]|uniref:23S rRNA (uracil(1939)-C(5))-methyltransferase RlmD n=1 Tax=Candidatus Desulfosporosinus nitrosoreducens TaxID=3401928 RepID=UPI0027F358FF|nr:23S rRNA (uracil(1939)-C(5))-methyltransferase RlmD [Desulfosporosinus sp. PR]MDQ7094414.1 23S rRNA (uracil(1939)-C(5))-methyltransferase RlmD [Desulfosporosinus sp. PR]